MWDVAKNGISSKGPISYSYHFKKSILQFYRALSNDKVIMRKKVAGVASKSFPAEDLCFVGTSSLTFLNVKYPKRLWSSNPKCKGYLTLGFGDMCTTTEMF